MCLVGANFLNLETMGKGEMFLKLLKLDWVGPLIKDPPLISFNNLLKKKNTCDTGHVTRDM